MTQYLLSVCHDDEYDLSFDSEDMARIGPKVGALNEEMEKAGAWVFGGGLMPASHAKVFRAGDPPAVTDGPFAETKEQIGGFWVIEAATEDEAHEWARKATAACELPVELRPFQSE